DNSSYMNKDYPNLGEMSADDFFVPESRWQSSPMVFENNAYIWQADIYEGDRSVPIDSWTFPYRMVFYANLALEGINNQKQMNTPEAENVKGSALFFRALSFYLIAQQF